MYKNKTVFISTEIPDFELEIVSNSLCQLLSSQVISIMSYHIQYTAITVQDITDEGGGLFAM